MPDSFAEAVEKRVKGFDSEGEGYDEETAAELRKLMPLTMDKPTQPPEDPSKAAYRANDGAFESWVWHPKEEGKSYYGYKTRSPSAGEDSYFKANPRVSGMAAEDNRVVLNPYSKLKPDEIEQVAKNEGLRIYMRQSGESLDFELTPEQSAMFKGTAYGDPANSEQAKRTIISRILTGDPSAGNATASQKKWAERVLAGASANKKAEGWQRHGASRDPRSGQMLKGRLHKTWNLLEKREAEAGYTIYKDPKSGKYYSTPRHAKGPTRANIFKGEK